jgi:hypothetical protein
MVREHEMEPLHENDEKELTIYQRTQFKGKSLFDHKREKHSIMSDCETNWSPQTTHTNKINEAYLVVLSIQEEEKQLFPKIPSLRLRRN